jgi:hypothetical protein
MSKTFTFAGTCVVDGATVYKFANDANRAAVLTKLGATDVNIIALPKAMDKDAAVAYLAQVGITATKPARSTNTKTAAVKVKAAKTVKVSSSKTTASEDGLREAYAEAMGERKANDMPIISFAQYKRDAARVAAFFAKCESNVAAKSQA